MRLIDADKLMLSLADWELQEAPIHTYEKPKEFTADDMQRMIWRTIRDCESAVEEQPTVKAIPLDKPFCKMAYGDYVCYNRNWLMKHLPMEMDILQGEAIPVEFIEKQIEKALSVDSVDLFYVGSLKHLIKEWEKEK